MAIETPGQVVQSANRFTGWYIAAAIAFIVLGIFAIMEPAVASLGVALLVGWLFIFGGIAHLITAFRGGGARQVIWQVLIAAVYVLGGVYLLANPLMAVGTLTLLLAAVLFVAGVFEIVAYFQIASASGWLLANGIVTLVLGGLIWFHWPSSSVWAIGLLVGVNLLLTGFTRLMLGGAGRRLINKVTG
jgi:uncharacterized membrane protein HdeD (DUF308 family)